jgi:hypothetical protein
MNIGPRPAILRAQNGAPTAAPNTPALELTQIGLAVEVVDDQLIVHYCTTSPGLAALRRQT